MAPGDLRVGIEDRDPVGHQRGQHPEEHDGEADHADRAFEDAAVEAEATPVDGADRHDDGDQDEDGQELDEDPAEDSAGADELHGHLSRSPGCGG